MRTALACPEPPEGGHLIVSGAITATRIVEHTATVTRIAEGTITVASFDAGRLA